MEKEKQRKIDAENFRKQEEKLTQGGLNSMTIEESDKINAESKKMTQEQQQEWSIKQAYIALGNLMTVCAVERIDSCPMEGFDRAQYDAILKLNEKELKSVLLLPVGYRAEDDMFSSFKKVRKKLHDAVLEM